MKKTLINLDGLEGKFLTIGRQYEVINGVSSYWVHDDHALLVEVNLSNFN